MKNTRQEAITAAKTLYNAGLISEEDYTIAMWRIGMLIWDEAIDLIIRANVKRRRKGC